MAECRRRNLLGCMGQKHEVRILSLRQFSLNWGGGEFETSLSNDGCIASLARPRRDYDPTLHGDFDYRLAHSKWIAIQLLALLRAGASVTSKECCLVDGGD